MVIGELHDKNGDYLLIREDCKMIVRDFDDNNYKAIYKDSTNAVYVLNASPLVKERIDYFLIWGHGLKYTRQILDIIRSRKDFEIITIQQIHVDDISELVEGIYSCDTVPLQHLADKTRYLLDTEPRILFILVKNKSPQEKLFGEGRFRHIQCQLVKDVKEEIRDKFNPRADGKRTEHHVIHASDYESQVEHVLDVLGLPPIEHFAREPNPDLDVPYHLPAFDSYAIKEVEIDNLFAKITEPINETPHYKYLKGDKEAYQRYHEAHFGKILTDDHLPEAYDLMIANFEYGRTTEDGKRSLILATQLDDDKYQILDGVHRAAILKHQGVKTVTIAEPMFAGNEEATCSSDTEENPEDGEIKPIRDLGSNNKSEMICRPLGSLEVKTTVFIITIDDPVLQFCKKAVDEQTVQNFKLDIIRNFRPFNVAMQEIINRCDTEYFIQVDEDMILERDAVQRMQETMDAAPDDIGMICFHLYDEDREQKIHGIKIFRTRHVKDLTIRNVRASEMDMLEQMGEKGIKWVVHPDVMGRHGTSYTPDSIYHRYKSMYEKDISVWNTLTWDIRKKADKYLQTGDPLELFALLGAAHGIINAPNVGDVEAKDFQTYNLKALDVLKRRLLGEPVYTIPYDPGKKPQEFFNEPLDVQDVEWNRTHLSESRSEKASCVKHSSGEPSEDNSIRELLGQDFITSRNLKSKVDELLRADSNIAVSNKQGEIQNYISKNAEDGFAHLWLGLTLWWEGKYEEAWREFEAAESLGVPQWRTCWYKALAIRDDVKNLEWRRRESAKELVAKVLAEQPEFEAARVYELYLNGYYSQLAQDVLVEDFFRFNEPRTKTFVDVGAYDGVCFSNTRYLFDIGWSGVCIEPVSGNFQKLESLYSGTDVRCVRKAIGLKEGMVDITVEGSGSKIVGGAGQNTEQVESCKLTIVLDDLNVGDVDFLSIDAEGVDFEVLQSLEFSRFRPQLIVIEHNDIAEEKKQMSNFMRDKNYVLWHNNRQDLFFRASETVEPSNFWRIKTLEPKRPEVGAGADSKTEKRRISAVGKSKTLSILHTVEFYYPHISGAEIVVQELSQRLVKRGHEVTIVTSKDPNRSFKKLNGVNIKEFDVSGRLATGFEGSDVVRYQQFLLNHTADVMMNYAAQHWATDLVFKVLPSIKERRVNVMAACGYSALSESRTIWWPAFENYFNLIIPAYLPQYDAVVYHSSRYQDYEYAQNHGFTNSVVIHNGTDEQEFANTPKIDFRKKYKITTKYIGLCVANFYEQGKRQDRIIEVVRQMNRPDFTMVFIGKEGKTLAKFKRRASGLDIRFLTHVPREDTVAAYHSADLFLLGSDNEASPLVIIEAKASRTPFISTDCGNVREWKGGIVCPPEKMAFHANRILDDDAVRKNLAEEGWKEWKEKLTWEAVVDRYEELYSRLYFEKFGRGQSKTVSISGPSLTKQLQAAAK
jgi:FkbM family methyltransferase